jgi:hypothetical protein
MRSRKKELPRRPSEPFEVLQEPLSQKCLIHLALRDRPVPTGALPCRIASALAVPPQPTMANARYTPCPLSLPDKDQIATLGPLRPPLATGPQNKTFLLPTSPVQSFLFLYLLHLLYKLRPSAQIYNKLKSSYRKKRNIFLLTTDRVIPTINTSFSFAFASLGSVVSYGVRIV